MTTRSLLERRNEDLVRDLNSLKQLVAVSEIPYELRAYQARVLELSRVFLLDVERNLTLLALNQPVILKDVLSRTQQATLMFRLLSGMWVVPILRASPSDRLCLTTIQWLHKSQLDTMNYPAVFVDGNCAVRPSLDPAPVYQFPGLEQRSLLYQPLLFHEYGHFLYRCHKQEMDDLVRDLRLEVDEVLAPVSQRSDRYSDLMMAKRQMIADTWYFWAQELFCDAVGLTIGGPCFLHAFSNFLLTVDQGDYYRSSEDLADSRHPVTWLRIHFLTQRAAKAGYARIAKECEDEWRAVARLMAIDEDYFGFYDERLDDAIKGTLYDMLVEANPRICDVEEAHGEYWSPDQDSVVQLFNMAWNVRLENPGNYPDWEQEQIDRLLAAAAASSN